MPATVTTLPQLVEKAAREAFHDVPDASVRVTMDRRYVSAVVRQGRRVARYGLPVALLHQHPTAASLAAREARRRWYG